MQFPSELGTCNCKITCYAKVNFSKKFVSENDCFNCEEIGHKMFAYPKLGHGSAGGSG